MRSRAWRRLLHGRLRSTLAAAVLGTRVQRAIESADEHRGKIGPAPAQTLYGLAEAPHGRRRAGAAHRVDAAQRLIQDECERVQVGRLAGLAALALLRRHVR